MDGPAPALPLDDELRRRLDEELARYLVNPSDVISEEEFHQRAAVLRQQFAAARKVRR